MTASGPGATPKPWTPLRPTYVTCPACGKRVQRWPVTGTVRKHRDHSGAECSATGGRVPAETR